MNEITIDELYEHCVRTINMQQKLLKYHEDNVRFFGINKALQEHLLTKSIIEELREFREKNTPKKPIKLNGYHQYKCPRCNDEYGCFCGSDMFGDGVESEYCQECGQKLDWSDVND